MTDPIFLVHADVRSKRTFWFAPQLSTPIRRDDPRSDITVRIETRNELPEALPQMVSALRQIQIKLGSRLVALSDTSVFAKILNDGDLSVFRIMVLREPDVLPMSDVGLERAIAKVYGEDHDVTRLGEQWRPFRSVACWYLWRALGNEQLG